MRLHDGVQTVQPLDVPISAVGGGGIILFNKSPEQMHRLGACGGRAYGRNQRARRAIVRTPPEVVPPRAVPRETVAQAIHVLDAQSPWLHGAERQLSRKPGVAPAPACAANASSGQTYET